MINGWGAEPPNQLAIPARDAGNEKWNDPEKNHPTGGSLKNRNPWVHSPASQPKIIHCWNPEVLRGMAVLSPYHVHTLHRDPKHVPETIG